MALRANVGFGALEYSGRGSMGKGRGVILLFPGFGLNFASGYDPLPVGVNSRNRTMHDLSDFEADPFYTN